MWRQKPDFLSIMSMQLNDAWLHLLSANASTYTYSMLAVYHTLRVRTCTALVGIRWCCSAGSVANRCTSDSGSSRSRRASTNEGYLVGQGTLDITLLRRHQSRMAEQVDTTLFQHLGGFWGDFHAK